MAKIASDQENGTREINVEQTGAPFQSSPYAKGSEMVPAWVERLLADQS